MTDVSISLPEVLPTNGSLLRKLGIAVAMAAIADWLFFGHKVGITVVIFIIVLEIGVFLSNPVLKNPRAILSALGVLLVALLPLVEALTPVSFAIGAAGAAYFALAVTPSGPERLASRLTDVITFLLAGLFQILPDLARLYSFLARGGQTKIAVNALTPWIIPVLLGGIFLSLFASANPLVENWLGNINFKEIISQINFVRVLFWLAMICIAWPFVHVSKRFIEEAKWRAPPTSFEPIAVPARLFGEAAIVRSLVLFNLLFAAQTAMDINYLWRGAVLPDGMNYATYAHRGAYPLIITALLAAGFVIAAMKPGSAISRSPLIRTLVFIWTGQNVLLVISSILRLDLYVEIYSLTYWRSAAFVWMLLVALGLVLIIARILLDRSNAWLVAMNLTALMATIYICCFVNFPHVIGTYNVIHSREISGKGNPLDIGYLIYLGPQAMGAMDAYIAQRRPNVPQLLFTCRDQFAASHLDDMKMWRAWYFRGWRLKSYVEGKGDSSWQRVGDCRRFDQSRDIAYGVRHGCCISSV